MNTQEDTMFEPVMIFRSFMEKVIFFKGQFYTVRAMDKNTLIQGCNEVRDKLVKEYQEQKKVELEKKLEKVDFTSINYRQMLFKHYRRIGKLHEASKYDDYFPMSYSLNL